MKEQLENISEIIFENIKHVDEFGNEYWLARELQKILEYKEWRNLEYVINNAKISCLNSNVDVSVQFVEVSKLSINVNGGKRIVNDYKLSRYACYLVAQNADPRKKVIALAQTYFAIQTRKQELLEQGYKSLTEDDKRIVNRKLVKENNIELNRVASTSGVKNFKQFTNAGYKGLYNGETANDIAKRKSLNYREEILDYMCSDELALNIFRISQTKQELIKNKIDNEYDANSTHYNVGKDIREFIKKHGGVMPEDMKTPVISTKELDSKNK